MIFFTSSEKTSIFVRYNEQFSLVEGCLLDLFIRHQLHDRDIVTSSTHRTLTHFRLIEPISLVDDFGSWQYDHWHSIFDMELVPHGTNARFPARWRLADDARIHCFINNHDPAVQTSSSSSSSHGDRPRTTSLDVFVQDVCALENNGKRGAAWLGSLHQEDIFTYEHLANLRQSEWDSMNTLTMNAKKTLKAAIDRERENTAGERRHHIAYNLDQEDDNDNELLDNIAGMCRICL